MDEMTIEKAEALLLEDVIEKGGNEHDFSEKKRKTLSKEKEAMPDGSFPIRNTQDLKDAIRSVGRAKDEAKAKTWIKKRAKELDKEDLLPETWKAQDDEFFNEKDMPLEKAEDILLDDVKTFEKAHTEGEIHKNGKWVWVSSAAGGKGDWRNKKKTDSYENPSGNSKQDGKSSKKEETENVVEKTSENKKIKNKEVYSIKSLNDILSKTDGVVRISGYDKNNDNIRFNFLYHDGKFAENKGFNLSANFEKHQVTKLGIKNAFNKSGSFVLNEMDFTDKKMREATNYDNFMKISSKKEETKKPVEKTSKEDKKETVKEKSSDTKKASSFVPEPSKEASPGRTWILRTARAHADDSVVNRSDIGSDLTATGKFTDGVIGYAINTVLEIIKTAKKKANK